MTLTVAILMDPPDAINIDKDSTFVLGLEAQKRGYSLIYCNPDTLSIQNGRLSGQCAPMEFQREQNNHVTMGKAARTLLDEFDLILMRQDNNGPQRYAAIAHMLDNTQTLTLNDPKGVRDTVEKLLPTHYPDLAPPTLITKDIEDIRAFHAEHKNLIIKPLNGYGGMDVYNLKEGDKNLPTLMEMFARLHPDPLVVQKFIPEIKAGDKRLIVVEGEPIGALLRVPPSGSIRGNLAVGGQAVKGEITPRDREICERIKPELIKRALPFVGVDIIGDYVTEINPKSPTGLQQIYRLNGIKCEETIWDAFETRLDQHRSIQ